MKSKYIIFAAILLQVFILTGMIGFSLQPLLTGTPVRLKVEPVDPRDLFRGDYVVLSYEFSRLNLNSFKHDFADKDKFYFGDIIYVQLKKDKLFHRPIALSKAKPEKGIFLKAICQHRFTYRKGVRYNRLRLKAGLESYFTDSALAQKLEKDVRNQKIQVSVTVMVTDSGQGRIQKIHYPK